MIGIAKEIELLEKIIGHKFKKNEYLQRALVHSSYANESRKGLESNERQEFLGDSVLGLVVSSYLFKKYPAYSEGELTRIRASLVCEKALAQFAKQIELGDYIKLGKGELSANGSSRPSIMADTFEAVIAAIYLDSGLKAAEKFIMKFVKSALGQNNGTSFVDYKTILQEIIQQNPEERLEYVLSDESGPDHEKRFTVNVCLNSRNTVLGKGKGNSKKDAEQKAAKAAIELMGYLIPNCNKDPLRRSR